MQKSYRNIELDGLRGLAALAVILGHCVTNATGFETWLKTILDFPTMPISQIIARLGHVIFPADAAVIVFFVLSGYVLWGAMQRKSKFLVDIIPFLISRAYRLLPVAMITTLLLGFVTPAPAFDVVKNAFLLSFNVHGELWSILVEMGESVLLFLIFIFVQEKEKRLFILIPLSFLLALTHFHILLVYLPAFILGASLHYLSSHLFRKTKWIFLAYFVLIISDLLFRHSLISTLIRSIAAWFIVASVLTKRYAFLRNQVPQFFGKISYCLYLLNLLSTLLAQHFLMAFGLTSSNQFTLFLTLVVCVLTIALPLSWLLHLLVEEPGMTAGASVVKPISEWIKMRLHPTALQMPRRVIN